MPFKSEAQRRFMFSQHPQIAKRWIKKYGLSKSLPEKTNNKINNKEIKNNKWKG